MKILAAAMAILFITGTSFAQNRQRLVGPAAKNYKFWLDDQKPTTKIVVTTDQVPLMGPAAKNNVPRSHKKTAKYTQVITAAPNEFVRGPKKSSFPLKRMDLKRKKELYKKRKQSQQIEKQRES